MTGRGCARPPFCVLALPLENDRLLDHNSALRPVLCTLLCTLLPSEQSFASLIAAERGRALTGIL
jgi:hypothetical protein